MPYELESEFEELWAEVESDACGRALKGMSVAVVGGGFAGLMAARELARRGVKVTVFEARKQVGGRVLSNASFSKGRITEEGAELIGSFHTSWLALARTYGLAMISRMDEHLYEREGLQEKLELDRPLSMIGIWNLEKDVARRALLGISKLASTINDPAQPWLQPALKQYDDMSVATALETIYKIPKNGPEWKELIFLLVNDEVSPLEEMNFLGLLCKVKGAQSVAFRSDGPLANLMRYWNELEVFRCADGCQQLAAKMADEIRTRYGAKILLDTAVTDIGLSSAGAKVGFKKVIRTDGTLAPALAGIYACDYVVLATPPSVWAGVRVTAGGEKAQPEAYIGPQGMGPAVKYFSDVKDRFWIKDGAAPFGGSLTLGQVWEGTDNQTRTGDQGIVLSVFAGPIVNGPNGARVPTRSEIDQGLKRLYPSYAANLKKTLFSDWPNVPFIRTGYAAPALGQIFRIGDKLIKPFRSRLFFAGEHTQMDFFGYMEGALRSGERAARNLMQLACAGQGMKVA